ncbi:hypothetical protein MBLNU230_g5810t1 [Neophaeotheca triangularis]
MSPTNNDQSPLNSFDSIYSSLTTQHGFPVLPAASPNPHHPSLTHNISSLSLHPTLECLLHILNNDLPSAHFLLRHMQNKPAWEGMYIHGILHAREGDYRNAEAWYNNVSESECFRFVWGEHGGLEGGLEFIRAVEKLRKEKEGSLEELEAVSKREIEVLVKWCKDSFGTERWEDGTKAWVEPSEENRQIAAKMLIGGEGWRQF